MTAQLFMLPTAAPPIYPLLDKAERIGVKPTKLVVWVKYTGFLKSRYASQTLFDPPLDQMLFTVLEDVDRFANSVDVIAARPEREPPALHGAIVVLTKDRDAEGRVVRWPVAYLVPLVGELDPHDVSRAFIAIGGGQ